MIITRNPNAFTNSVITFNMKAIERVDKFKYLWIWPKGNRKEKMLWLQNMRQWTSLYNIQTLLHTTRNREAVENVNSANIH